MTLFAADKVGRLVCPHVHGLNLLGVDVVDRAVSDEETGAAINSHVAFDEHFVRFGGVVLRGVGINIGVADVDGDIAVRGGRCRSRSSCRRSP